MDGLNTKDIWQALTSTNVTEPFFDGVFPLDGLKSIKHKPALVICNTDPSDKPGKHWLLFFFHGNIVNFYDSLGNDLNYYDKKLITFVKKYADTIETSNVRIQPKIHPYVVIIVYILHIKYVKV